MTKAELIAALAKYPDDTVVMVDGYEWGFNDIDSIDEKVVAPEAHGSWFGGSYNEDKRGRSVLAIRRGEGGRPMSTFIAEANE